MQYQLWIFDKGRGAYSTKTAVDGGVFDVDTATGDVIVPIDAKLEIFEPTLFAVTTEPPGGVVVHEDDEARGYAIVLTASPVS
jgi:DNA/RNA-binding domain of Phe-tRNA-synthetase-like protein